MGLNGEDDNSAGVKVFIFLLSGLFCCLGFSGVFFLLFGQGHVIFLLFGRGRGPRPNSKKNTSPPKQQRKNHPPPKQNKTNDLHLPSVLLFLLFGRVGVFFFFAVWAGGRFFFFFLFGPVACNFFAVWAGGVFVFCCLGRGRLVCFAVWAEGVFFFLLFGRGTGVHSLTGLPGLSSSDPTTKMTKQQKKHVFHSAGLAQALIGHRPDIGQ